MFASYFKTAHGQRVFFFLVPFAWAVCTLAVDRQLGRRSTGSRRSFFPRTRPLSVSMFCTRRRANRFQRHLTRTRRAMPNFVRYFSKNVFSRLSIFGTELGLSARGFQWPLHGSGSAADRHAVSFRSPPPPLIIVFSFFSGRSFRRPQNRKKHVRPSSAPDEPRALPAPPTHGARRTATGFLLTPAKPDASAVIPLVLAPSRVTRMASHLRGRRPPPPVFPNARFVPRIQWGDGTVPNLT